MKGYISDRTIIVSCLTALVVLGILLGCAGRAVEAEKVAELAAYDVDTTPEPSLYEIEEAILDCMAEAFAQVESRGNSKAYRADENACGCLQIRQPMVDEANRIIGEEAFHLADCFSKETSFALFRIIMREHNPELDVDAACDIWNPGCSRAYRVEVMQNFQSISNSYAI